MYPHDNPIAGVRGEQVVLRAVRAQGDHQLEVALVGVGAALLAHVVVRCLREVEAAHRHLGTVAAKLHAGTLTRQFK